MSVNIFRSVALLLMSLGCFFSANVGYAIGFFEDDFDTLAGLGWENPPADLLKPSSDVMIALGVPGNGSAVLIAPNWALTAGHVTHNSNGPKPGWGVSQSVAIWNNGIQYGHGPAIAHPTRDLSLIPLQSTTGGPANFPLSSVAVLADEDEIYSGMGFTYGGFGFGVKYDSSGTLIAQESAGEVSQ